MGVCISIKSQYPELSNGRYLVPIKDKVKIHVTTAIGNKYTLYQYPHDTIENVKESFQDQSQIPIEQQKLIISGSQFPYQTVELTQNSETISNYGIQNGTTLHCIVNIKQKIHLECKCALVEYCQNANDDNIGDTSHKHNDIHAHSENQPLENKKIKALIETKMYKQQLSSIQIPRECSRKISSQISQQIPHLFKHMIKSSCLQNSIVITHPEKLTKFRVFNFGFTQKNTGETMYCVASENNERGFQWKIIDKLYTENDIKDEFDVSINNFSNQMDRINVSINSQIEKELTRQQKVANFLSNEECFDIIKKWQWTKTHIYNKKNNERRVTLSLSKNEFLKLLELSMSNTSDIIIPFLMPDDQGHHIEFAHIISLHKNCDVCISYRYSEELNQIEAVGIHLDGEFIKSQHQLLFPDSQCDALNNFTSDFDYLIIGNADEYLNQMNIWKQKFQRYKTFVTQSQEYYCKMTSNIANITTDNINHWIKKSKNVKKKSANISLNLSQLFDVTQSQNFDILMKSPMYISDLQSINNFYFQQTLNPSAAPIMTHPKHIQIPQSISSQ
eukprot:182172_1